MVRAGPEWYNLLVDALGTDSDTLSTWAELVNHAYRRKASGITSPREVYTSLTVLCDENANKEVLGTAVKRGLIDDGGTVGTARPSWQGPVAMDYTLVANKMVDTFNRAQEDDNAVSANVTGCDGCM